MTLRGELDLSCADDLTAELTGVHERHGIMLVRVDLADVGFIDSTTISALIAGYHAAAAAGTGYEVRGAQGQVEKVLKIAGVLLVLQGHQPTP